MILVLTLLGDQVRFKEVGTGDEVTRGGCVLVSFMYQLDQAMGAHMKFYFWVCWGRLLLGEVIGLELVDSVQQMLFPVWVGIT